MNDTTSNIGTRLDRLLSGSTGRTTSAGWVRVAGIVLLIGGLRAWAFERQITRMNESAVVNLSLMQQERTDNRVINDALLALQQYWRVVDSELEKDQVLALRDAVVERFPNDRPGAVRELASVVATFVTSSPVEESALDALAQRVRRLDALYADSTGEVLARYRAPGWYLLPTAALLNDSPERRYALEFNHALALMSAGDVAAARTLLESLRQATADDREKGADVLFAQARLQYDAFTLEPDPTYLREALELTRQSLRRGAEGAIPKLFLEYLLSAEPLSGGAEVEPERGQGSGEGQGERGVISEDAGEF